MDTAKPTKNTTLLSSKKGNLMRELTVEDVYEENFTQKSNGAKEIMKHI